MSKLAVAVLGAGSWGTALADVLVRNGHDVRLWARNEAHVEELRSENTNERYLPGLELAQPRFVTSDIGEALDDTDLIVLACPSRAVREVAELAAPYIGRRQLLVSTSKGIDLATHRRMSEVVGDTLGENVGHRTVVLSGPSFADELIRQLPTAVVVAGHAEERALAVQAAFRNGYFRVYTQHDMIGVELGGALKNVIAVAAGISDGLELGSNARAALINRGLAEVVRLAVRLGAAETTLGGLAGLGDLVLTCTGPLSRNRSFGMAMGSGRSKFEALAHTGQVVEGVWTTRAAYELSRSLGVEMPITESVYRIVYDGHSPRKELANLMAREPKPERWG